MEDLDPGADGAVDTNLRALSNFGVRDEPPEVEQEGLQALNLPPGGPATLAMDIGPAKAFLAACMDPHHRVSYGLGAKVPFHDAVPGRDFTKVDCSGFVREAIWRATTPNFNFKDGSVVQHEWVAAQGFAKASIADGAARDGAVRIAFLPPQATSSGIGHVVLIHDGTTLESHGGTGPDALPWTGQNWQAHTMLFVLAR